MMSHDEQLSVLGSRMSSIDGRLARILTNQDQLIWDMQDVYMFSLDRYQFACNPNSNHRQNWVILLIFFFPFLPCTLVSF